MSFSDTVFNNIGTILPSLPPKPKIIKKEFKPKISEEEFKLYKKIITEIYYIDALEWKKNKDPGFLRQISGPAFIVNGVKQTIDWTNMHISDSRYMRKATNDTISDIIKKKSCFAIYHHLITDNMREKMPEDIFKKYIISIWSAMKQHNLTLPAPSIKLDEINSSKM